MCIAHMAFGIEPEVFDRMQEPVAEVLTSLHRRLAEGDTLSDLPLGMAQKELTTLRSALEINTGIQVSPYAQLIWTGDYDERLDDSGDIEPETLLLGFGLCRNPLEWTGSLNPADWHPAFRLHAKVYSWVTTY